MASAPPHHPLCALRAASVCACSRSLLSACSALGFEQVAQLKEVGHKFGTWLDVIYMQRLLE